MDTETQQKWMASISRALEELKRGSDLLPWDAQSDASSGAGSADDGEEDDG
jgi:hypothetical protein